jgi:RNA polymerase sigma factor (sigma-70 family)
LHENYVSENEDYGDSLREEITSMLKILSPRQRDAIYYRYVEDLTFEEITKLMDMNYQSVHNLIQRGVKKLKKHFNSQCPVYLLLFLFLCYALRGIVLRIVC